MVNWYNFLLHCHAIIFSIQLPVVSWLCFSFMFFPLYHMIIYSSISKFLFIYTISCDQWDTYLYLVCHILRSQNIALFSRPIFQIKIIDRWFMVEEQKSVSESKVATNSPRAIPYCIYCTILYILYHTVYIPYGGQTVCLWWTDMVFFYIVTH